MWCNINWKCKKKHVQISHSLFRLCLEVYRHVAHSSMHVSKVCIKITFSTLLEFPYWFYAGIIVWNLQVRLASSPNEVKYISTTFPITVIVYCPQLNMYSIHTYKTSKYSGIFFKQYLITKRKCRVGKFGQSHFFF